jgi:hypothetical protein
MKRLLIALATTLTFSIAAFAGSNDGQDLRVLSAKLWKAHKGLSSLKNQKDGLAIVYGGEDISHKLSTQSYVG